MMRRHSPYNYAFINPVFFIDPDGMMPGGFGGFDTGSFESYDFGSGNESGALKNGSSGGDSSRGEATIGLSMPADNSNGSGNISSNVPDADVNDGSNGQSSTVVDGTGKILDYKDDGDSNIYLNKRGGLIVGQERSGVNYIEGVSISSEDLREGFILKDGLIQDYSLINLEMRPTEQNSQIRNCQSCNARRCNGASHSSVSDAIEAGVKSTTTPAGLGVGGVFSWVLKNGWGFVSMFSKGYYENAMDQYKNYNEKK